MRSHVDSPYRELQECRGYERHLPGVPVHIGVHMACYLLSDRRIFDQKYTVEGIENPVRMRIKDVIFVMEASVVIRWMGFSGGRLNNSSCRVGLIPH